MEKVPFNQEGLDLKRQMLKELPPPEFEEQLELIQRSTRDWCIDNFILNEDQIEYLNSMPNLLIDEIGLNARIAIQFDEPLILETPAEYVSPMSAERPRKTKTSTKGGGSWDPGTGYFKYKVEVTIKFEF